MERTHIEQKVSKYFIVPTLKPLMRACYYIEGRFNLDAKHTPAKETYQRSILSESDGNEQIRHLINSQRPCMVSRIGSTELACIDFYRRYRLKKGHTAFFPSILNWIYFQSMKYRAWRGSGIFPPTNYIFDKFSLFFLESLSKADLMGVWFNAHEDSVINDFCPQAQLVSLRSLEPYYHPSPWSESLRGKKVLVVHPFSASIERQYKQHACEIFGNKSTLPDFDLKVIQAVQSLSLWPNDFIDWFDAYEQMCDQISHVDFDVAIIGAGAYGLPLASFVKEMGKQAIHMGGSTQILFGIKGARWDNHPIISKFYNDSWVRPLDDERPHNYKRQESGCYW